MPKIIVVLVGISIVGALVFLYRDSITGSSRSPIAVTSVSTNFVEAGILHFPRPESGQAKGTFEFSENGATTTLDLEMDEMSVCATPTGAVPCMAMSVTFDVPFNNRRAMVEGERKGNTILIRKVRVLQEGESAMPHEPGKPFISWMEARRLIEECKVQMLTQTHALDIYLELKDGTEVRAVEPMIDEVFTVVAQTQAKCGTFPVATE